MRTFKGHSKGVYPMVFIPAPDNLGDEDEVSDCGDSERLCPGGRTQHQAWRHVDHWQCRPHCKELEVAALLFSFHNIFIFIQL